MRCGRRDVANAPESVAIPSRVLPSARWSGASGMSPAREVTISHDWPRTSRWPVAWPGYSMSSTEASRLQEAADGVDRVYRDSSRRMAAPRGSGGDGVLRERGTRKKSKGLIYILKSPSSPATSHQASRRWSSSAGRLQRRHRHRACECRRTTIGRMTHREGACIHRSVIMRMEDRESSYAPRLPQSCTIVD